MRHQQTNPADGSGQYARESAASNFRSREWERVMLDLVVTYWVWLISALIAGCPAGYWLMARASAEEARRAAEAKAAEDARRVREAKAADVARGVAKAKAAEGARRAAEVKAAEDGRRIAKRSAAATRPGKKPER
jgi:ATPase subunit of ABC transporter with duplicated ATPase domains